jgi:hypothetical protein
VAGIVTVKEHVVKKEQFVMKTRSTHAAEELEPAGDTLPEGHALQAVVAPPDEYELAEH